MSEGQKRKLLGRVLSDKMDKTVVVEVLRRVKDSRYHKFVSKKAKYIAHDEANECKAGDTIEISESRPLSKRKRWVVTKVIDKAVEV